MLKILFMFLESSQASEKSSILCNLLASVAENYNHLICCHLILCLALGCASCDIEQHKCRLELDQLRPEIFFFPADSICFHYDFIYFQKKIYANQFPVSQGILYGVQISYYSKNNNNMETPFSPQKIKTTRPSQTSHSHLLAHAFTTAHLLPIDALLDRAWGKEVITRPLTEDW